jgi:toxin ParE1/3/4
VKPVRIRPAADADIDHALAYLWEENPAAASNFLDAVERDFQKLSLNPGIGSPRYAHILPIKRLRMWPVSGFPHLVFYLERADHIDIIRVLHSARDIPSVLLGENDFGA